MPVNSSKISLELNESLQTEQPISNGLNDITIDVAAPNESKHQESSVVNISYTNNQSNNGKISLSCFIYIF